jgi:osmotically-inducible protein OsmY
VRKDLNVQGFPGAGGQDFEIFGGVGYMKKENSKNFPKRSKGFLSVMVLCATTICFMMAPLRSQGSMPPLTDETIEKAVHGALLIDKGVPAHLIDVEMDMGVLTLTGHVPHLRAKERATFVAETIKGVQSIVNRITVASADRSDADVKADILEALREDPATASLDITVTGHKGEIVLIGTVPSLAARAIAREIAVGVWGVKEVKNNLTVNLGSRRNDQEITNEISRLLENNVWINENPIQVFVQEGQVILKGVVGSLAEKRRVRRVAMVKGVTTVNDKLLFIKKWAQGEVRRNTKVAQKTDKDIKDVLTTAFRIDPRMSVGHLTVAVQNGVVTLQGKVPHLKIKNEAEKVAKHTRGVLWVKNFIKVRPETVMRAESLVRKVNKDVDQNVYVNSHNTVVSVVNGKAHHAGTPHSNFEKEEAEKWLSDLSGVLEIENRILVQDPWEWKPDYIIQKDVNDEFWWSPFVDSEDMSVKVKNGMVTLQGMADSWWEEEMAVRNAYEGGARHVESQLTIQ